MNREEKNEIIEQCYKEKFKIKKQRKVIELIFITFLYFFLANFELQLH